MLLLKPKRKRLASKRRPLLQRLWLPNTRASSRKKSMQASLSSLKPSGIRRLSLKRWSQFNLGRKETIHRGHFSLITSDLSQDFPKMDPPFQFPLPKKVARDIWICLKIRKTKLVNPWRRPASPWRRPLSKAKHNCLNLGRKKPRRPRRLGSRTKRKYQNLLKKKPNPQRRHSKRQRRKPRKAGSSLRLNLTKEPRR